MSSQAGALLDRVCGLTPSRDHDVANDAVAWLAAFGHEQPAPGGAGSWKGGAAEPARAQPRAPARQLYLLASGNRSPPMLAQAGTFRIIFHGILYNRVEVGAALAGRLPHGATDADLVLSAYHERGADAFRTLRGSFALIVWDGTRDRLLCARDPVGLHPLFYAEANGTILLSPSIDTLIAHPGVSRELNRAALVDHLARRWLKSDDTYFARVRRVLPCHVLYIEGAEKRLQRYWDPAPAGAAEQWVPDEEVPVRFDALLERAVARSLAHGAPGLTLSGGIDSSAVAMVAARLRGHQAHDAAKAFSLVLPGGYVDEAGLQQQVAAALDLPHLQVSFADAVGPRGALAAALELNRFTPAPLGTILRPAFDRIFREAGQHGCRVLLSGDGADEWVGVNFYAAADLLRAMDWKGLRQLWQTHARAYPFMTVSPWRALFWEFGVRVLLREKWLRVRACAARVAPRTSERWRRRYMQAAKPAWIAPDAALRAEVDRREKEWWARLHTPPQIRNLWLRFACSLLGSPQKLHFHEEVFFFAQRAGVRVAPPFWDADLIEFTTHTRPQARMQGGFTKSLLRGPVVRRFPGLGFEQRLKSYTGAVILSAIRTGAAEACAELGRKWVLAELGVADADEINAFVDRAVVEARDEECLRLWDIMNLETWVRAHCGDMKAR
ncbi:MAG TPA: asparagine synthase-related protein [Burkholderiales bacterium]|nr:asparagine synthase-related protein [Burkholderiales bacterium]